MWRHPSHKTVTFHFIIMFKLDYFCHLPHLRGSWKPLPVFIVISDDVIGPKGSTEVQWGALFSFVGRRCFNLGDAEKLLRCKLLRVQVECQSAWLCFSEQLLDLRSTAAHSADENNPTSCCWWKGGGKTHWSSEDPAGVFSGPVSVSDELQMNWTLLWNLHVRLLRDGKRWGGVKKLFSRDRREDFWWRYRFSSTVNTLKLVFSCSRDNWKLFSDV